MATEKMELKIKKIENKEVWAKDVDGEKMWKMDLVDPQMTYPKMVITSEERLDGFNIGDTIEITLKNQQKTLN